MAARTDNASGLPRLWASRVGGPVVVAVLAAATALVAVPGRAADWRFVPVVGLSETYTDNALLTATDEESELISSVNPGFSLRGKGNRLSVNVFYEMQALFHHRDTEADEINHNLQGEAEAELVEDFLFLDLRSSVRQENVSNTAASSSNNLIGTANQTEVTSYSASPRIQRRFADFGQLNARLQAGTVDSGSAGSADHVRFVVDFDSGSRFVKLPWSVSYSQDREDDDSGAESDFERFDLGASYPFNRKFALTFGAGHERDRATDDDGAITWNAGVEWKPTPRTDVAAGLTHREFGSSFYFNGKHRMRRLSFTAAYGEDRTSTSRLQFDRVLVPLVDDFGNQIAEPRTGDLVVVPVDTATLTDETIIRQRFDGAVRYTGRRLDGSVALSNEHRDFSGGGDERVFGASASVSRRVLGRGRVGLDASWQKTDFRAGGDRKQWDLAVRLAYQYNADLYLSLSAGRQATSSSDPTTDFDENNVNMSAQLSF